MEAEGLMPCWVKEWIVAGHTSFYQYSQEGVFQYRPSGYERMESRPEIISLQALKASSKVILSNADASLIDLGDEVACREFHSKGNSLRQLESLIG